MKIIIVGGGISGLTTYLSLLKYLPNPSSHSITIYESHRPRSKLPQQATTTEPGETSSPINLATLSDSTALVGGGLGISPNGLRVLRSLSPDLHAQVLAQGFPVRNFVFKGANGWELGSSCTSNKETRRDGEDEDVCVASSRHGIWETLRRYASASAKEGGREDVVKYRKVIGVERCEGSSGKIRVRLRDEEGNEEVDEADLVIGADGVKSVVRKALFGDERGYEPVYR